MKGNILRRIISIILASFICTQSIFAEGVYSVSSGTSVNEEQTLTTITVGDVSVGAEEDVTIPLSISNNVGLTGLALSIGYDSNALTLTEITKGEALTSLTFTKPGSYTLNPIKLIWDGMDADNSNGSIVLLKFTMANTAESVENLINLTVETACDANLEDVEVVVYQGLSSSDLEIESAAIIEPASPNLNTTTWSEISDTITSLEVKNNSKLFSYEISAATNLTKPYSITEIDEQLKMFDYAEDIEEESCIPNKDSLLFKTSSEPAINTDISTVETNLETSTVNTDATNSQASFTFDDDLITPFNTITGPTSGNGANEPKFSYNSFLEENISDYSGELTLNFEDLVLDGVNGLDLRIGRTYQTVAPAIGEPVVMILPDEKGKPSNILVNDYSTYLLDRYNLGAGWGFSFPSVQIETEYIPDIQDGTGFYNTRTELYYHTGNGDVYQVDFTEDAADSNLKGYYKKDIQFKENDNTYSYDSVTSHYSMTLADKTKQYFAKDGRLIGIVDRFGNTINFEYELYNMTNRVPGWDFWFSKNDYDEDDCMWTSSTAEDGTDDAYPLYATDIGSKDGYVMYFERGDATYDTYIISQPIQVKPNGEYSMGIRVKDGIVVENDIEILRYDTVHNFIDSVQVKQWEYVLEDGSDGWVYYTANVSTADPVRYIQIKINKGVSGMYIDSVSLEEPKPLLSKITDTVGRTITFEYNGNTVLGETKGNVTLTVTSPDGNSTRVLTYNKEAIQFNIEQMRHKERRLVWYLNSSSVEGADGATVKYTYEGGTTTNADGTLAYPQLYLRYDSKTHSDSDSWVNKPVLNSVRYKDRKKIYEYETVRKHLGDDGYYDTLRIKKKYDMYAYVPEGETKIHFKGELGAVNYSYSGLYDGNSFNNETGYPNYTFNDETTLNELWTVTKTGKTTDTVTFSNDVIVQTTSSSDGTIITSDYTNHPDFKNSPTQIKNTITQNGVSKNTYILYSYNDWGGIKSETKEVDEETKNNEPLLEKYTTRYEYNDTFHFIKQKSYYNNIDSPQVHEINVYDDDSGLLMSSENAVGEKTYYHYENTTYPYLVTKITLDDPMRFHNLMGGDRIVTYTYDTYGLYPLTISETYDEGTANTSYERDYITGDVLIEALPDGSYTQYTYYSDGKVKLVASPTRLSVDSRYLYTIEKHIYNTNVILTGYGNETPTYDVEQIIRYVVYTDEGTSTPYALDTNYYDAVGNLKQSQQGYYKKHDDDTYKTYLKSTTRYYHDTHDRLIKMVDHEGHTTLYTYDGFDRPNTITDSENNIYTYTYDSIQNKVDLSLNGVTESVDRKLATQYFDLYGNVIENVVYPNNSSQTLSESYEYDLNNNVISYTNANGNKTEYLYDAANRLIETTMPDGVKAESTYSVFNKPAFEKIYDAAGNERLARITYRNEKGDLSLKFFNYDEKMVDTDRYSSDAKGRITSINEGENPKTLIYDQSNHPIVLTSGENQINRIYNQFGEISATSTDGNTPEIQYGYDYVGNLSEKLQNNVHYMAYAYSSLGNIVQNLTPANRLQEYSYTPNGNLDTISSGTKIFDYDYYDTGFVKSITYPNNLKTTYEYDNINRITKITTTNNDSAINTFEYEYDNNGNTTKEIRNGAVTSYSYDSLDRLISVTYGDGTSVSYEYDALNNRTKETYSNGDVKDYVYDEKYQLKEIKLNGQVTDTFTYNESGAVVAHNNKTYTYDEWDRMSGYSDGTDTYTYKYDANGIRTQKNDKQYVIDINNNVVAETDSTGAITDEILWGHQPLARKTNGSWYYYIYNAHGDVVGLVNDAGTVVNTYEYTPWGEIRSETETVDNPIKYAGEYYDDELGMIYLRARYYNPNIGRFTSLDIKEGEISNPLDLNRYVYCRNNPIKYTDPNGDAALATIGGAVLICAGNGLITGGIYKWNGKPFGAGFINGFVSCLGTELGAAIGTAAGPGGIYAGTIIGNAVGSAAASLVENIIYHPEKSASDLAKAAAESAAWGVMAGVSSSYWKYAINLANEAGSAAQTLMKYDKKFGEALKVFFDQLANILSSQ